jgi:AcrR family transcriptional regulator
MTYAKRTQYAQGMRDGDDRPAPPLHALWMPSDAPRRRSSSRLTRERIVAAALALVDAEGLGAFSMSRVAERLDTAPMSLYRHIASKDELVALMLDAAVDEPPAPATGEGWRERIGGWARALLELAHAHPWALDLPLARIAIGPNRAAWLDRGLAAFAATTLSEQEKAALILLVNDFVFSHARLDPQSAGTDTPLLPPDLDPSRYPSLRAALDAGILGEADRDAEFRFGLDRILDGIEVLVKERRTTS